MAQESGQAGACGALSFASGDCMSLYRSLGGSVSARYDNVKCRCDRASVVPTPHGGCLLRCRTQRSESRPGCQVVGVSKAHPAA